MRNDQIFVMLVLFLVPMTGCIENSEPEIVGDWYFGEKLEVIFEQKLKNASEGSFVAFGSLEGLYYLRNNYSISYLVGPQAVPLDNFSEELVVKLKLSSRSTSEGFRQLEIAIDRGNLIRRVSGLTVGFKEHRFDF